MRTDGQTDMTKLIVVFPNFVKAPSKTGNVRIDVTLRRVHVTIAAVYKKYCIHERDRDRVCVCSLSYQACKMHALYYIVICVLSGPTLFFPNYVINGTIFGKSY
jgi:hypothetical protein